MAEIKTGGPAFPTGDMVERDEKGLLHGYPISSAGMTLRDYFAAKALPSLLSELYALGRSNGWNYENVFKSASDAAYEVADAMIAACEGRAK